MLEFRFIHSFVICSKKASNRYKVLYHKLIFFAMRILFLLLSLLALWTTLAQQVEDQRVCRDTWDAYPITGVNPSDVVQVEAEVYDPHNYVYGVLAFFLDVLDYESKELGSESLLLSGTSEVESLSVRSQQGQCRPSTVVDKLFSLISLYFK